MSTIAKIMFPIGVLITITGVSILTTQGKPEKMKQKIKQQNKKIRVYGNASLKLERSSDHTTSITHKKSNPAILGYENMHKNQTQNQNNKNRGGKLPDLQENLLQKKNIKNVCLFVFLSFLSLFCLKTQKQIKNDSTKKN